MQGPADTPLQPPVPTLDEEQILKHRNVDELRAYVHMLTDKKIDKRDPTLNGFDEEFYYIETKTAQDQFFGDYKSAIQALNRNKNRYSNVLPPEATRVKLTCSDSDEQCSDYINANYINGLIPNSEKAYIATQGPLQATFPDFWRMVWETNSSVIIMLTREVENGRLKCDRYWPEPDVPLTAGHFKVTLLDIPQQTDELIHRVLQLEDTSSDEPKSRVVSQFQYIAWPDHGLPVSTDAFLDLAEQADEANKTNGPLIVHCSAGIGRSGTFCTVHATIEKIKLDIKNDPLVDPKFNIVETVLFMRKMRPGMVQTKEQYMFCCYAIVEEAERLLKRKNAKPKMKPGDYERTNSVYSIRDKVDNPIQEMDEEDVASLVADKSGNSIIPNGADRNDDNSNNNSHSDNDNQN